MAIHCFQIYYSKNSYLTETYLPTWLTSWTAWTEEEVTDPKLQTFQDLKTGETVECHGFTSNRFEFEGGFGSPQEDAEYIMSQLMGEVGYLASYCDWWIVRWHQCFHDEGGGCGDWIVIDSSNNYSGQTDVPSEVSQ